jgi:hypothetical protein
MQEWRADSFPCTRQDVHGDAMRGMTTGCWVWLRGVEQGGEAEDGEEQSDAEEEDDGEEEDESKTRGNKSKSKGTKDKTKGSSKGKADSSKGKGGAYTVTDYVRDRLLAGTADLDASEVGGRDGGGHARMAGGSAGLGEGQRKRTNCLVTEVTLE